MTSLFCNFYLLSSTQNKKVLFAKFFFFFIIKSFLGLKQAMYL